MDCQRAYEKDWRGRNKERLKHARLKRKAEQKQYSADRRDRNWARYMSEAIGPRCRKNGIPFDLDKHEKELNLRRARGICELTGLPLKKDTLGRRRWDSPSIDRINPKLGYLHSNVRVVCFGVNAALGDWGETVFKKIATAYLERST